jgi:hypothetical protein
MIYDKMELGVISQISDYLSFGHVTVGSEIHVKLLCRILWFLVEITCISNNFLLKNSVRVNIRIL